jgi:hypothetical protein
MMRVEAMTKASVMSGDTTCESGHFIWEDAADEYAAILGEWWDGGYRRV